MAALLIPISMFIKNYSYTLPTLLHSLPIYFFGLFILVKLYVNPEVVGSLSINIKVVWTYAVILLAQLVMILYSYSVAARKSLTSGLATGPINAFLFFGNLCLIYILMVVMLDSITAECAFFKSIFVTIILFFILVLLPQIIATVSPVLDSWVNLIGRLFEGRHQGRDAFYANGSYVTTLHRINGFDREASFFAAKIGIIFIPPVLAVLKNQYNVLSGKVNDRLYCFWFLLLALLATLFFAKTSTGFVVIAITGLSMFIVVPKSRRYLLWWGIAVLLVAIAFLYSISSYVREMLNQYLFEKSGTDNRVGGTIALLKTFLHYPLFGVGSGYTSFYNFKFVPEWTTHNSEYLNVYRKIGYPDLSVLGSVLASYGLIAVIPIIVYFKNKVKQVQELKQRLTNTKKDLFLKTVLDSFYFYLVFLFILAIFIFDFTDEIYFVMLMFYIVVINRAARKVGSRPSDME